MDVGRTAGLGEGATTVAGLGLIAIIALGDGSNAAVGSNAVGASGVSDETGMGVRVTWSIGYAAFVGNTTFVGRAVGEAMPAISAVARRVAPWVATLVGTIATWAGCCIPKVRQRMIRPATIQIAETASFILMRGRRDIVPHLN